jgi:glycerophosphoryl diester phosphodiesterase
MGKLIKELYQKLNTNFKILILFEIVYRLFGVLIVFPLSRLLFYTAIDLSGFDFITNRMFIEFLFKPTTLFMGFILILLISIYIVIEMVFLAIIFDYSHRSVRISFKDLLLIGSLRSYKTIKRYHLLVILPAGLFFLIVETFHLASLASTITIPTYWIEQLSLRFNLSLILPLSYIIFVVIFIETAFTLNYYSIEGLSFKEAYNQSRKMLKRQRFWMVFELIFINIILSLILVIVYAVIIFIIGALVYISRGEAFVLGFLLTLTYSLYSVIGFIATAILIPLNYALLSTWFYTFKNHCNLPINREAISIKKQHLPKLGTFRRYFYAAIIIIFAINITNILSLVFIEERFDVLSPPEIIAHRGASIDAPENTFAAFEEAIYQGADALELDVRFTADGVPIVMHDRTLGRTTDAAFNIEVNELTLAQIQNLDAGGWYSEDFNGEPVPTLEAVLMRYGSDIDLFIELKDYDDATEVYIVELIEIHADLDRIKLMSFNELQLIRLKALNEEIESVLLVSTFYGNFSALINKPHIDHFAFEQSIVINNPTYVERIQSLNKQVFVWTVNDEEIISELSTLYVNGIITDKPLISREIIYSEPNRSLLTRIINDLFSLNSPSFD